MALTFQAGETIRIELIADDWDAAASMACSAALAIVPPGTTKPALDSPPAASFAVTHVPPAGGRRAHWLLAIAPAVSSTLAPGTYWADARIQQPSGDVWITDPVTLDIRQAVTRS